jgi:hypothetical protein
VAEVRPGPVEAAEVDALERRAVVVTTVSGAGSPVAASTQSSASGRPSRRSAASITPPRARHASRAAEVPLRATVRQVLVA